MLDMQATWVGMKPPGAVQVDESISQGRVLKIGEISSQVIDTPGHTEGSICVYFPEEKKLIAGDTLFAGSIGRTDLPGGSMEKIMRSLHTQVLALPDETEVTPGHGPNTTIGEERETNPFLQK
jgi:glyoxylase-like metal-dependent hydrolase (beta-lactamase superfamily II)